MDDETIQELQEQAAENNRSLEEEMKAILDAMAERSARNRINAAKKGR